MMDYKLICAGLYIEITSYCNRKCPYCYNDSKENGIVLGKNYIMQLFDESVNNGLKQVSLSGGEPFSHPDIDEIIKYAESKGIRLTLITNLSFLNSERALDLLQNGHIIQLTLDSLDIVKNDITRGKGSYDLIQQLIDVATKENIQTGIVLRLNLSKANSNEIVSFVNYAKSKRLKTIDISTVVKTGRGCQYKYAFDYADDIVEIAKLIKNLEILKINEKDVEIGFSHLDRQVGCVLFGNGDLHIGPRVDPNGDVFPCQLFSGDDYVFGNIQNHSLQEILKSERTLQIVDKIRSRKTVNPDCEICPFTDACMCGCPAVSNSQTGDILAKYDQCGMIKFFMKERLKELGSKK